MKHKEALLKNPFSNKFVILLFIFLGLFLYINTFENQMFWDDNDSILNNQYVHDIQYFPHYFSENLIAGAGLVSDYWRPMLLTVFSFQWQLWQDWAPGFHFVNTAFHITNAILLFYILHHLFKNPWLAIFTALIFLAHPLQTEAVTYIAGLGDPLSVFFIFLGLLFYLRFRLSGKDAIESKMYYLSLLMYIFALMTKETAIIMPGLVFLVDFFFEGNAGKRVVEKIKVSFKRILSFVSIGLLYIFLRATVLNFSDSFNLYGEENPFTQNFHFRLFTFFRSLTEYFRLLFLPFNLHMERSIEIATSFSSFSVIFGAFVFLGLLTLALTQIKKYPIISFGILWFFVALFPMSNLLVPVNDLIYEHWMYVPMIGIFLVVLWLGQLLGRKISPCLVNKDIRGNSLEAIIRRLGTVQRLLFLFYVIFLVFLFVLTIKRNEEWRDPITFYNQTLEYAPESYRVINNLGMAYADVGDYDQAKKTYKRAVELEPTVAVAYHNLGNSYQETGDFQLAIEYYNMAISNNPAFLNSYAALGNLYLENDDYENARRVFERSLGHTNLDLDILLYLAELALEQDDLEGSLVYLEQALEIEPSNLSVQGGILEIKRLIEKR
jgi:protein O-mannosyl-transferase